jgi:hypothetical protein
MRAVYLIGIGQTAVTKHSGVRGRYFMADAIEQSSISCGLKSNPYGRFRASCSDSVVAPPRGLRDSQHPQASPA